MLTVQERVELFGKNVKTAMEAVNISVLDLAAKTGFNTSLIEKIISGDENIAEDIDSAGIIKIADALGIQPYKLLYFEE